jgi:hypothetical protein
MDDFMRLTDEKPGKRSRRTRTSIDRRLTPERVEKLKKTFQPYWMRGMMLHRTDGDEALDGESNFDQV